jgi:hypothetical protein
MSEAPPRDRPGRRIPRATLLVGGGCLLVFALLQVPPVDRTNPPIESEVEAPVPVTTVLRRACYDCHSHETRWPWYGYVAPFSWILADHVHEGREHVNFSAWDRYTAAQQAELRHEIWEEVAEGEMPLPGYVFLHPQARLAGADHDALRAWSEGAPRHDSVRIDPSAGHHHDDDEDEGED